MQTNLKELKTYSFYDEDIDLITFALRRYIKSSDFTSTRQDAENLLEYIERLKKEHLSNQ
jgi:hypothetical protein